MYRRAEDLISKYIESNGNQCLLVTGARQVGKTHTIRKVAKARFSNIVEINFFENPQAKDIFENASGAADILRRISVMAGKSLVPSDTLVFFDEIQECPEIVTAIKFLVEDGSYRYIMSGSLLGVELKDVRSFPVGYMDIIQMYPMDFEEFLIANGVSREVIDTLAEAFRRHYPIDDFIHQKMLELFRLYLVVGGMPAVVKKYIDTNNIYEVESQQRSIIELYKKDISKYDQEHKLLLNEIFELIPGELNCKNKRFILKNLNEQFKFSRHENSFLWLKDAGVALPTYCVDEPKLPLLLSRATNLFKLFLSDVGLLSSMYMNGIQMKVLTGEKDINFGSIYENFVAQELSAHGFQLYYFNNKKQGELDFVIEHEGDVLPVEVKSGKAYERHNAMSNVLANEAYDIKNGYIFCNENVRSNGKTIYFPVYMATFLRPLTLSEDFIYKVDLSGLS